MFEEGWESFQDPVVTGEREMSKLAKPLMWLSQISHSQKRLELCN